MDQIRFEGNFSHSYSHGCIKSPSVCYAQWPQYLEITHFTCSTERLRKLHVPSEYGSNEITGKLITGMETNMKIILNAQVARN